MFDTSDSATLPNCGDLEKKLRDGLVSGSLATAYGGHYWADRVETLAQAVLLPVTGLLLDEWGGSRDVKDTFLSLMRLRRLDDLLLDGRLLGDLRVSSSGWQRIAAVKGPLEDQLRLFPGWQRPRLRSEGYPSWNCEKAALHMEVMASLARAALNVPRDLDGA